MAPNLLDESLREVRARTAEAWRSYMKVLVYPEDQVFEDSEISAVIDALKLLPISWRDARDDLNAVRQKRQLEAQIEIAEREANEADAAIQKNAKLIASMEADQARRSSTDMSADFKTPRIAIENAKRKYAQAGRSVDAADANLRNLRLSNPRAFGVCEALEAVTV